MRLCLSTLAICISLVTPSLAVTVVPLTFEQLVNQSAAVVLGRVDRRPQRFHATIAAPFRAW